MRGTWVAVGLLALAGCANDREELRLVGVVEWTQLEIAAPASETIVEIPVRRGERVREGELLVRLDPTVARAEVAGAEAALAAARRGLAVASSEVRRVRELHERNLAPEQQREQAELALEEAEARVREAEARLRVAKKRLAELSLVAPSDGVVDQLPYEVGERVPAGAVLAVLLRREAPWVRVWLPERVVARVRPGTPAWVYVDGVERRLSGRVLDVAREPEFTPHFALTERERVRLVYEARVVLEGSFPPLRPGIPAEVVIPHGEDSSA
ncbi:MAG: hypothetical protein KatS3mg076_2102 [Candidatus Binatia bacterium]|nr:MAG: hypothetical protein KatS3mg076_2102 [Candidatus Binatia bacterium]